MEEILSLQKLLRKKYHRYINLAQDRIASKMKREFKGWKLYNDGTLVRDNNDFDNLNNKDYEHFTIERIGKDEFVLRIGYGETSKIVLKGSVDTFLINLEKFLTSLDMQSIMPEKSVFQKSINITNKWFK